MTSHDRKNDPAPKDPAKIEAEIEQTRGAIGQQLGAIGEKLSPERLKDEAKEMLADAKEATVEKLRDVKDQAFESVSETVEEVADRARYAGTQTVEFVRSNAVPLGLIGLGVGLLLKRSGERRRASEYDYSLAGEGRELGERPEPLSLSRAIEGTRERATKLTQRARRDLGTKTARARERARELGENARTELVRAEKTALDFGRENPLAVGAGALAAGLAVGLLLPPTRREDRMLGRTRDHLLGEVRGSVQGAGRVAKEAVRDVKSGFKDVQAGLNRP